MKMSIRKEMKSVWVIFLASALTIAVAAMVVVKIGHKIWLSMRKDEQKFEKETEKENK